MKWEFHPAALEEYDAAAHYYAQQRSGLDLRFIVCVEEAIERLLENPRRFHPVDGDIRRCLKRVFPYAVIYSIEARFMLIVAVAHRSREPGYWKHRLK